MSNDTMPVKIEIIDVRDAKYIKQKGEFLSFSGETREINVIAGSIEISEKTKQKYGVNFYETRVSFDIAGDDPDIAGFISYIYNKSFIAVVTLWNGEKKAIGTGRLPVSFTTEQKNNTNNIITVRGVCYSKQLFYRDSIGAFNLDFNNDFDV